MSSLRTLILALCVACLATISARAEMTALARIDAADSAIRDTGAGVEIALALSQPVPWRVFTLDNPRRLVMDFSDVAWPDTIPGSATEVSDLRLGRFQPGWSRLVLSLDVPYVVGSAELETGADDGSARLSVMLLPSTEAAFAAAAGAPQSAVFVERKRGRAAPRIPDDGVLHVVLDPGHGGIDPGAEAGGLVEADLMLTFARELREVLLRSGGYSVAMTRNSDVFVPLETRISLAREAGAEVFLSLHADALPEGAGQASGATIYTLSEEASDLASRRLAERHDQSDLLAGVDLAGQTDEIALVLMDLARRDTAPRANRLADALVRGMTGTLGRLNSRPRRSAAFSVLKAPDFPSVLIELGFLSSARDRERLADPSWRLQAAAGIRDALRDWAADTAMRN
ncbi:MAG: N-acetylmuramoyl-L-alanine amidase [Pseudomonadota bacterium]